MNINLFIPGTDERKCLQSDTGYLRLITTPCLSSQTGSRQSNVHQKWLVSDIRSLNARSYPQSDRLELELKDGSSYVLGFMDRKDSWRLDELRNELFEEKDRKHGRSKSNKMKDFQVILRLIRYRKDVLPRLALMIGLLIIVSLSQSAVPYLTGRVLFDDVLASGGAGLTGLLLLIAAILVLELGGQAIQLGVGIMNNRVISDIVRHIKTDMFTALVNSPMRRIDKSDTGDLLNKLYGDTMRIQEFFNFGLPYAFVNGVMIIFALVFLASLNWLLMLSILLPIPLVVLLMRKIFTRIDGYHIQIHIRQRHIHSFINQIFTNFALIKAYGRDDYEGDKFSELIEAGADINIKSTKYRSTAFLGIENIFQATGLLVWFLGIPMAWRGDITAGTLISFTAYVGLIYNPLRFFSSLVDWYSAAMEAGRRMFDLLDSSREEDIVRDLVPHEDEAVIGLEDVDFSYVAGTPVLRDISLEIQPGDVIGVAGSSGAGKSTLIQILSRLYEPSAGTMNFAGMPFNKIESEYFRRYTGVVLQNSRVFSGTVAENISYPDIEASRNDIIRAARTAGAHEFIMSLPDGYNTRIGEGGQLLSGGETQRLTIARAILHDPPFLILDEATSALDTKTEKTVQESLEQLVKGRTVVAVAHRLSTLSMADKLIVIENGRIVEAGTHKELAAKNGRYASLLEKQREGLRKIADNGLEE